MSMQRIAIVASLFAFTALSATAPVAGAFPHPPPPPPPLPSCVGDWPYQGTSVHCAVPSGVTGLDIVAVGGYGGGALGGTPAVVKTSAFGLGGQNLTIDVGGAGSVYSGFGIGGGGWNGGGNAGNDAGGGGGASDVLGSNGQPLIVAAGGGGSGAFSGGAGGSVWPGTTPGSGAGAGGAAGGGAGTNSAGGSGGSEGAIGGLVCGLSGSAGDRATGGAGGLSPLSALGGSGGGGGGGLYGGGGGGAGSCFMNGGGGGAGWSLGTPVPIPPPPAIVGPPHTVVSISAPVPQNTSLPSVSGSMLEGQEVTELRGVWNDSPDASGYSVQWLRCDAAGENCSAIPGETGAGYQLAPGDVGATLRVSEQASNKYGTGSAAVSNPTPVVESARPIDVLPPTIQGAAQQGQTLTALHGTWDHGASSYSEQWLRCDSAGAGCAPIPGAVGPSYVLGAADVGRTVAVSEVAVNSFGIGASAVSSPTAAVAGGMPVDTALPTVTGTATDGQTLTAQHGVWSNNPTGFQYQWYRCNASGSGCQPVAGQSGATYRITPADIQFTMRVQETASNGFGSSSPATSAPVGPIVDAPISVQAFALVGTVRSILPGPVGSLRGDPSLAAHAYTVTVSWGDGSTSRGRLAPAGGGGFLVKTNHIYGEAGSYTISIRVATSTGDSAVSTNRVSVFTAGVCQSHGSGSGHNCLGQIALPAGCVIEGDQLRVSIPVSSQIAGVRYSISGGARNVRGTGPHFAAALPTAGLRRGTHRLSANIALQGGGPKRLVKTRPFAVC